MDTPIYTQEFNTSSTLVPEYSIQKMDNTFRSIIFIPLPKELKLFKPYNDIVMKLIITGKFSKISFFDDIKTYNFSYSIKSFVDNPYNLTRRTYLNSLAPKDTLVFESGYADESYFVSILPNEKYFVKIEYYLE
jgi:hypothetical protein